MRLEEISGFDRKMWFHMIQVEASFITDTWTVPTKARAVPPGEGILRGVDLDLLIGDITATVGRCQQIRCHEKMTPIRRWRKGGITDDNIGITTITDMGQVEVQVEVEVAVITIKPKPTRRSDGAMNSTLKR